jgi:hypothetical protein
MFLFQRANIEGIAVLLTAAGILAVVRRKWWLAAVFISLAGAMKIFPLILLGLLLPKRRYREFAFGFVVVALATLASLAWLGPNPLEAQRHISEGLAWFQQAYAAHPALIASAPDHSLFPIVKLPVIVLFRTHPTHPVQFFLKVYMVFAGVAGVALWAGVIRKQPMLNQILALAICAVLLPPVSYDYTLAHLFVPFGLLCLYACDLWRSGQEPPSSLRGCFILFAFIFTDMMYMTFKLQLAGQFRAIALLLLLIAVLRLPMPWAWLGDGNGLSADHGAVVSA